MSSLQSGTIGSTKRNVFKSLGILVVGILLTGGGLFLWQNNFTFSMFSSASSTTIQAIISLGEQSGTTTPDYAVAMKTAIDAKQQQPVELVNRAEQGLTVSSLRNQAVLGYNDVTKPITQKVYFLVVTGQDDLIQGITDKDMATTVAPRVSKNIIDLINLASARPGVFPAGFTVFLTTLPDPLDGTGDVSVCNGKLPNYGKAYTKSVYTEINSTIRSTAAIYPLIIKIVDLEKAFSGHGLSSGKSWFKDCFTFNSDGNAAVTSAFKNSLQTAGN